MRVSRASAEVELAAPCENAWSAATLHSPALYYGRFGVIPAVSGVKGQHGDWDSVGKTRTLSLSDGGSVVEEITDVATHEFFAYNLSHFTGVFGAIVAGARAEWDFWRSPSGSGIRWTYSFTAKPGAGVVVALIVRVVWARYMRVTLAKIARAAESNARS